MEPWSPQSSMCRQGQEPLSSLATWISIQTADPHRVVAFLGKMLCQEVFAATTGQFFTSSGPSLMTTSSRARCARLLSVATQRRARVPPWLTWESLLHKPSPGQDNCTTTTSTIATGTSMSTTLGFVLDLVLKKKIVNIFDQMKFCLLGKITINLQLFFNKG